MSSPSPANANTLSAALPQAEWPNMLRAAALETFATAVGVTVTAPEKGEFDISPEVTGMVGIAGPLRAIFSLRCSLNAATTLSAKMLGVPLEEAEAQQKDAVGEICNIIAGHFKAYIGLGKECSLSFPTVLCGFNYQVHSSGETTSLAVPLLYGEEVIWIALDIRL